MDVYLAGTACCRSEAAGAHQMPQTPATVTPAGRLQGSTSPHALCLQSWLRGQAVAKMHLAETPRCRSEAAKGTSTATDSSAWNICQLSARPTEP